MEKNSEAYNIYDYIVVGAGASGLFFAANMEAPCGGLILEKTSRAGTKLLMSGGGHCNITHAGPIKDFIPCYGESGKRIRKVLYKHNNLELIHFLEGNGIPVIEEPDGRIFPKSKKASDVLGMLLEKATGNGFRLTTGSSVDSIKRCGDIWKLKESYYAKKIIIATGGCSYPKTGSDGSMYDVLRRDLGISITDLRPALTPISVEDYPYSDIAGVSLPVEIKAIKCQSNNDTSSRGPQLTKWNPISRGHLLFTHRDFSGPAAINISGALDSGDSVSINYLYPIKYDETFSLLQGATLGNKMEFSNIIAATFNLPKSFSGIIASRSGGSTKAASRLLTEDTFKVKSRGTFDNAMVTRGGVPLDEINLSTMELKSHPGVHIIGEALDVDGQTGGYNLQFAYSSALTCASHLLLSADNR